MLRFSPRTNRAHLVNWREWGEAAFDEAHQKDKPIAVFITAFWCGFCQNMDETTLSNDETIALLNAFFIPIRVEESQRPDVDLRYNQDGWPSIAFLTPRGGHLFTVNHMAALPFINLLVRVVNTFKEDNETDLAAAQSISTAASHDRTPAVEAELNAGVVAEVTGMLEGLADGVNGGFGGRRKFLHTEANEFYLYLYEVTGEPSYLDHVVLTLDKLRSSRTFDAKDGGFYRYSSRADWQEPHPEKLLHDQAGLMRNYLYAYLLTGDESYATTARGLVSYVNRFLAAGDRPVYFGCQDYVRPERQPGVRATSPPELFSYIDEYVYCDANAQLASAFLDAWWLLGDESCKERAKGILEWLWRNMRSPDGGMLHYWDGEARVPGLLMDAALVGGALVDAFATLGDATYLDRAKQVAADIERLNRSPAGGYFDLSSRGPGRLAFPMTVLTQNATAATFFTRLADLSGETRYRESARWAFEGFANSHRNYEAFAAGFGHAVARLLAPPVLADIRGVPGDEGVRALTRASLTQLRCRNLVPSYHEDHNATRPSISLPSASGTVGPIFDAAELTPELRLARPT